MYRGERTFRLKLKNNQNFIAGWSVRSDFHANCRAFSLETLFIDRRPGIQVVLGCYSLVHHNLILQHFIPRFAIKMHLQRSQASQSRNERRPSDDCDLGSMTASNIQPQFAKILNFQSTPPVAITHLICTSCWGGAAALPFVPFVAPSVA